MKKNPYSIVLGLLMAACFLVANTGCGGPGDVVVNPDHKDLRIGDSRDATNNMSGHKGGLEVE